MPSQASRDATLKVSPNLTVTLLAANLRDFLRGTDQGWLYLEVGFSPYYIGYLHPKFDCCEDQLNETKTALKMPIKNNSLMGIFYFESHHDVGALDENSRFIALQQSLLCTCSSRAGIGGCSVIRLEGKKSAGPCHPPFLGPDRLCCRNTEQGLGKGQKQCTKPVSRQAPKLKPLRSSQCLTRCVSSSR